MDPQQQPALAGDQALALAQWQHLADQARLRLAHLEAALNQERENHVRALRRLEQQSSALESELVRAEQAEEEVARLQSWIEYHKELKPAYEAALERISSLEEKQRRSQEILADEEDHVAGMRQEIQQLREELERRKSLGAPAINPTLENDQARLQRLAFQDPVTGLPNFHHGLRYLQHQLATAARSDGLVALARVDIHRLRDLNVYLGTDTADEILRQFASRFQGVLGPDTMLCRGRDDEFWLVVCCSSGGPVGQRKVSDQLGHALQRLQVALKRPFEVGEFSVQVSIACGAAYCQGKSEEAGNLVEYAGLALTASKRAEPVGKLTFFESAMQLPIHTRMARVPALREALQNNQFELYFQPMVQLENLQIQGVESLLRWNHPEEGKLLPGEFIEAALESGVIVSIGEWVARHVCRYSQSTHPYLWSMNVSAQELMQANFMRRLTRAIESAQLAHPEYLVVEISEKGLSEQNERLTAALKQLRDWGIQLAIDDFAFNSVSFKQLQALEVRYIKLSQEVTHQLNNPLIRNLVRGAVLASHDLGCIMVAEGVEKMEQLDALKELGCHWGQGHLLQPPADIEDIWKLLALDEA